MSRREQLLHGINLQRGRGIEIGPLAAPLVGKEQSNIRYVDWADQQTLRARYAADPNVDVDEIVPVDAVWGEQSLKESLSGETGFDYLIASHVIEHVPDMIGWVAEIAEVLRPGGHLSLAIPDRRFTFDYLRQTTRLGDLIDAWLRRDRRPSPGSVFDFAANAVLVDAAAAWRGPLDPSSLPRFANLPRSLQRAREALDGTYHDSHCWVFTPLSLLRIMVDLVDLDLLPYRCARFHDTEVGSLEMLMVLERRPHQDDDGKAAARESFMLHLRVLEEAEAAARRAGDTRHLNQVIKDQNRVMNEMAARIAMLEGEAAALRSSTSWRITKPLRTIRMSLPGAPSAARGA